jgi:hypothetical protein
MWRAPAEPRIGHTGPWPPLASVPSMAIVGASGQRQHVAAAPAASTRSQQQHAVAAPGAGTRGQQWHAASNGMKLFITIELPLFTSTLAPPLVAWIALLWLWQWPFLSSLEQCPGSSESTEYALRKYLVGRDLDQCNPSFGPFLVHHSVFPPFRCTTSLSGSI